MRALTFWTFGCFLATWLGNSITDSIWILPQSQSKTSFYLSGNKVQLYFYGGCIIFFLNWKYEIVAEVGFERCYDNWLHTLQIIAFDLFEWLLGCLCSSLWSMYLYIVFAPLRSIVVTFPFECHIYLFSCAPVLYEHSTPALLGL